jgi:dTDP-4-dehydrorhamnose 3,5-epimerase
MKALPTAIPDVWILEPQVFGDARGFFFESYNAEKFKHATGLSPVFVQDNHSRSTRGVLRGLHYQTQRAQGKLVRVVRGSVFDVAVDIRKGSATFGHWVGVELSEENQKQLWIPAGFAHGFMVTSDIADFVYKTTDYYFPEYERCIAWNDQTLGIVWPESTNPIVSMKDQLGSKFQLADSL